MYTCRNGLGHVHCSVCGSAAKGRTIRDHRGSCEREVGRREKEERKINGEETVKRVRDLEGEREEVREKRGEMREREREGDGTLSPWQPMVVWLAVLVRGERAHTKYCARPMREK